MSLPKMPTRALSIVAQKRKSFKPIPKSYPRWIRRMVVPHIKPATCLTLSTLNEDVLLEITFYLSPLDILSMQRTCRALRTFCCLRSVWYQAAKSLITQSILIPFRDPLISDISHLSSRALQCAVIRAAKLDSNLINTTPRPHTVFDIGTYRLSPSVRLLSKVVPLKLTGDFQMVGPFLLVTSATTGIYLWDLRRPHKWLDSIPLHTLTAFHVDLPTDTGSFAWLAFGAELSDGEPYLHIYRIPLARSRLPTRFSHAMSLALPSPVKQIKISGKLVFGILHEPRYGALYVCSLTNRAWAIFEPTTPRYPWIVSVTPKYFVLSSFDERLHSIVVQLIPQSSVASALVVADESPSSIPPLSIPEPESEFLYELRGNPTGFASKWLPLSHMIPVLCTASDSGTYIFDRFQLRVTPGTEAGLPASLDLVEHTRYCTTENPGDAWVLRSGMVVWTRNNRLSPSTPLAVVLLLSPIRAAVEAQNGERGKNIARDMYLPAKLEADKIIGMDLDEATGRWLIGLSNGKIWILSYS